MFAITLPALLAPSAHRRTIYEPMIDCTKSISMIFDKYIFQLEEKVI